ncbi:MAG: apolipoprotein N-acyltransferase [Phycisphaerales bacterium]|nr:apolipoprotein N-acyltransferase [Phycisphaerales bacterium]
MTQANAPAAGWRRVALFSVLHAVCWTLAFPPFELWFLAFVAVGPLAVAAVAAARTRTVAVCVFLASMVGWMVLNRWVGSISGAGLPAIGAYLASCTVLAALCIRRIGRSARFARVPLAALLPIGWLGVEHLRGHIVFDGYPWYLVGQPLIGWIPLAQVADLAGVLTVGILPLAVSGVIADAVLARGSAASRRAGMLGTAAVAIFVVAYGIARVRPVSAAPDGPVVTAIQTDVPQSNKVAWSLEQQQRDFIRFRDATYAAALEAAEAGIEVDLCVWPETMLPGPGFETAALDTLEGAGYWPGRRFVLAARDLVDATGTPTLFGTSTVPAFVDRGDGLVAASRYNSVVLVEPEETAVPPRYDKVFLTPFGETMPYIRAWPWLQDRMLAIGARGMQFNLDAGESITRFEVDWTDATGSPRRLGVATPICFEDTVPELCRAMVWSDDGEKVADLLVNASNDGWFGDSDGIRRLHNQVARFRSIENRVPLIRAVNTGISCMVDSSGRLVDQLPARAAGILGPRVVELDDRVPIFATVGAWPGRAVLLALVVMLILPNRKASVVDPPAETEPDPS